jgi:hypothetical protein
MLVAVAAYNMQILKIRKCRYVNAKEEKINKNISKLTTIKKQKRFNGNCIHTKNIKKIAYSVGSAVMPGRRP